LNFIGLPLPFLIFPAATALALVVIQLLVGNQSKYLQRLTTYGGVGQKVLQPAVLPGANIIRSRDFSRIGLLQTLLSSSTFADNLQVELSQAGIPLKVGEYVIVRVGAGAALALVVTIFGLPWFAMIPAAAVGFFIPQFYLRRLQGQRLQKFNDSLVDALSLMANAMKSGSSFLQGLDLVARELPPPLGDEFARLVTEISVGTPVDEALQNLAKRIPSYDLFLLVTAVLVQRETGGNLAEILESISSTIRERIQLLRQVQVMTAQERMGAILVGSLPIVMGTLFTLISPEYTKPLFQDTIGLIMLGAAAGLEIIGFVVMSAVSKIEV
jgi:tight adherence protein B